MNKKQVTETSLTRKRLFCLFSVNAIIFNPILDHFDVVGSWHCFLHVVVSAGAPSAIGKFLSRFSFPDADIFILYSGLWVDKRR